MPRPETTQAFLDGYGPTEEERAYFALFEGSEQVPPGATTPAEAQSELVKLGYDPSSWKTLISIRIGSHYLRACGIVALGDEPRILYHIVGNIRAIDYLEGRTRRDVIVENTLDHPARHTAALQAVLSEKTQ